jgi:autotransporter family porin
MSIGTYGTLNIGAASGEVAGGAGTLNTDTISATPGARIVFNHTDTSGNYRFTPVLTGSAEVIQAAGDTSLTGVNSQAASVDVSGGVLRLLQSGAFSTSGDYTTRAGATTVVGPGAALSAGTTFTQEAGSTLAVTPEDNSTPLINAGNAQLGGELHISGFAAQTGAPLISSSALAGTQYAIIHTSGGITGDFTNSNLTTPDYLVGGGRVSADGRDYNVGLALAWTSGGQTAGTGTFTMASGTGLNVDTVLSDQIGSFNSGWDGRSLTKAGDGLLVLSANNTYSGPTTVTAGTLALSGVGTLGASTGTTVVTGGTLDLGATAQTQAAVNQSGGTLQNGTMNTGTWQLTGGTLAADATMSASTRYDLQAGAVNGVLNGAGALQKSTAGTVTIAGTGSQVASADVQAGTLQFTQPGAFTTAGGYATQAGATTDVGLGGSTLAVGGALTQAAGAILTATLDDAHPVITAQSAQLDGELRINGFAIKPDGSLVKSSELANRQFTLIQTTGGVTGGFSNNPQALAKPDFLVGAGQISPDGKDYNLGLALAWTSGGPTQGTGTFTLAKGTGFEVDTVLADQGGSFASGWDGASLTKAGDGLLALSAVNTYTGATTVNGGTLRTDVADSLAASRGVTVNGGLLDLNGNSQRLSNLAGTGGEVRLNGATLTAVNATAADSSAYAGDVTDGTASGSLTKAGDGSLTLSGKTGWTGDTRIDGGTLVLDGAGGGARLVSNVVGQDGTALLLRNGATLTGTVDPTSVDVGSGSTWNMTGDSQAGDVSLAGTLNVAPPASQPMGSGHTLTVANWTGQGGTVVLNTALGGDGSATDKIVVNGNSGGNTFVKVNNAGGQGAQTVEGIQVVEVNGQSDGTFTRSGRIVAGAYDYGIVKKGADWYLTSQPVDGGSPDIRPEAGSYTANLAAANTMFITSLHDRLGETQYTDALTGEKKVTSLWLRQVGGHSGWKDDSGQTQTQANRYVVQLGGDLAQWTPDGLQRWHLGVMGGYGNSQSNSHSSTTGNRAEGQVSGYSVGLYATWYQNDETKQGMYADSWAQYGWFNNDVKGQDAGEESYDSDGGSASLELGYTHRLGEFTGSRGGVNELFIQPQAQAVWMGVKGNGHRESNGTRVSDDGDGNLQTRLGVRTYLKGHSVADADRERSFQPYVEVNWLHNTTDFGVRMDDVAVHQAGARNIGEIKTGVEGQLSPRLALWGNVGVQVGDKGYSDASAILGAKYSF